MRADCSTDAKPGASLTVSAPDVGKRYRLGFLVPLLVFMALAVVFGIGLTLDPRKIPSPLIEKLRR